MKNRNIDREMIKDAISMGIFIIAVLFVIITSIYNKHNAREIQAQAYTCEIRECVYAGEMLTLTGRIYNLTAKEIACVKLEAVIRESRSGEVVLTLAAEALDIIAYEEREFKLQGALYGYSDGLEYDFTAF